MRKRPAPEMRFNPYAQRHLDRRQRAALAPNGRQVRAVAPANLPHVETISACGAGRNLANEPSQLGLGLRRRQPFAAAACALGAELAVDAPAV